MAALEDGTPFPSWAEVIITSDSKAESPVLLRIELEQGRPMLSAITVFRRGPGESIGSSTLRSAAVQKLTDTAVSVMVESAFLREVLDRGGIDVITSVLYAKAGLGVDTELAASLDAELARRKSQAGGARRRYVITPPFLEEVKRIYESDETGRPIATVATYFRVTYRNAARWVTAARESGLLPADNKGETK
jgi:hypothetical protein